MVLDSGLSTERSWPSGYGVGLRTLGERSWPSGYGVGLRTLGERSWPSGYGVGLRTLGSLVRSPHRALFAFEA